MPRVTLILISIILATIGLGIYISAYYFFILCIIPLLVLIDCLFLGIEDSDVSIIRKNTFVMKRVKTEYGRFFIYIKDGVAHLYRDRLLFIKLIAYRKFTDVEQMKKWIKSSYDMIYKDKLEKDEINKQIKNWNGYIDIQSERDDKLNNILK